MAGWREEGGRASDDCAGPGLVACGGARVGAGDARLGVRAAGGRRLHACVWEGQARGSAAWRKCAETRAAGRGQTRLEWRRLTSPIKKRRVLTFTSMEADSDDESSWSLENFWG